MRHQSSIMASKLQQPCTISFIIICILFFFQIISNPVCFSLPIPGNETDRLSLLTFKAQITNDPLHVLTSWNQSLHFCEWSGVTCGRRHRRVVQLDLYFSKLEGKLSPHIGNLSFLRMLNLRKNSLSYTIPQELGRLRLLQVLNLHNNKFVGEIPTNISRCSKLQQFIVGRNNLTGRIPEELGSLSKLQVLNFEENSLFSEIPPSLGNLSSLERLYGVENHLFGGIPRGIGRLNRLEVFSLGGNNLSDVIPPSIYNLSSLTLLDLGGNQLHGSLPPEFFQSLPNLEILRLHGSKFHGLIPISISNASNLLAIELSENKFRGKVPIMARLANLVSLSIDENILGNAEDNDLNFLYPLANNTLLEELTISSNNIGGVLPKVISNFSVKLTLLAFGENPIRGNIPTEIGNLFNLEVLAFDPNQLTGHIPSSIGKLHKLVALSLFGNNLSGGLPSSIGNLTSLIHVYLGTNQFHGSIPSSLGNCRNLLDLDLSHNNLGGPIPKEVFGVSSLSIFLLLNDNQFTGSIPLEVGKLVNLGMLDVSKNKLQGEIPESIGSCKSLETLNMSGNNLQGGIPLSLSSLRGIKDLDLSHNNLAGQIPRFLGDFKLLETLNLSYNDLEGQVPTNGFFENASVLSLLGNKKLCGVAPQLNLPVCSIPKRKKQSTKLILIIVIPGGAVAILMFLYFLFLISRKRKSKTIVRSPWEVSFRRVNYQDVLKATDGFSTDNLIGVGGFGSVYKGILQPDGTLVAVKVLNLQHKGASKSFIAECEALANIRHRNLVKVLTACSSIDFQGNDFKALIYEFLANGSLEGWLHPVHELDEAVEPRYLNPIQRLNIAIDVANALDYLHNHCSVSVVHCDLKPNNVLLDADMTAHVGDFGLARFLPETSIQLSSNQTSSIGIRGTVGYAPPEYGMGSEVSIYGDMYSYGILVLEMFTGKRPTDSMFEDGKNLRSFAEMALSDRVMEVVDPILLTTNKETNIASSHRVNHGRSRRILECLIAIIKVGVACSTELPKERMNMSNVVPELLRIRNILQGRMLGHQEINNSIRSED